MIFDKGVGNTKMEDFIFSTTMSTFSINEEKAGIKDDQLDKGHWVVAIRWKEVGL